jgi:C_GCAxxG_C_C family probable redox protein
LNQSDAELSKKAYELAFEYERNYGSCPQCVLLAISKTFDLRMDDVIKAGHALAGGAGLSGYGTCGALSGGMMSLSFVYGRAVEDIDKGRFLNSYRLAKLLYDRFVEEFGGCSCRDVQKKIFGRSFNMWDSGEYKEFEAAGGHIDKCPDVAGKVARWVAEIHLRQFGKGAESHR